MLGQELPSAEHVDFVLASIRSRRDTWRRCLRRGRWANGPTAMPLRGMVLNPFQARRIRSEGTGATQNPVPVDMVGGPKQPSYGLTRQKAAILAMPTTVGVLLRVLWWI